MRCPLPRVGSHDVNKLPLRLETSELLNEPRSIASSSSNLVRIQLPSFETPPIDSCSETLLGSGRHCENTHARLTCFFWGRWGLRDFVEPIPYNSRSLLAAQPLMKAVRKVSEGWQAMLGMVPVPSGLPQYGTASSACSLASWVSQLPPQPQPMTLAVAQSSALATTADPMLAAHWA